MNHYNSNDNTVIFSNSLTAERGISLGCVVGGECVSSSEEESSLNPIADGPLLATLKYVRDGGVILPANDLADLFN